MTTKYAVGHSSLTNKIYAGRLNKKGDMWAAKTDVTLEALESVALHVIREGGVILTDADGSPLFQIVAEDLRDKEVQP